MRKINHESLFLPTDVILGSLEKKPEKINQLLDFYECYINVQVQKYSFNAVDCACDQEDLKQEIRLQLVKSLENLKIKLNDKNLLENLRNSNNN